MQNKKKFYLIVCVVSSVIVLAALVALGILFASFKQSREAYSQLAIQAKEGVTSGNRNIFWNIANAKRDPAEPDPVEIPIDFDFLLSENEDIIGWIQVDGTKIDYPILYDTTFNRYYLNHNFKGTTTGYGSIFVLSENANDFTSALNELIKQTLNNHKRIIFNGDGYSAEWIKEAKTRGLLNLKTTTEALPYFLKKENINLFAKHGIYSEQEVKARYEIQMEEYAKLVNIEVKTMLDLSEKEIIPACIKYLKEISEAENIIGINCNATTVIKIVL